MKTCDTCVHWDRETKTDSEPLHPCRCPKLDSSNTWRGENNRDSAGVVNGEPYGGGCFGTDAKFGCIHHEEKK